MLGHGFARACAALAIAAALALALAAGAAAAPPKKGALFQGQTKQGELVTFEVGRDGRHIFFFETALVYRCTGEHDGQAGSFFLDEVHVDKSGRFRTKQTLSGTSETTAVTRGRGSLKGWFKRRGDRVSGRVRSKLTLKNGETCDSGSVRFGGRVL